MTMSNQPIFSGRPGEDVDLYIDQCRYMWAGMQMDAEEKKEAIATTLFVGLRDAALRFGRTLPKAKMLLWPTKKQKHEEEIRRDERARITRVIEEMGHDVSALPERFQRGLGVPKLRSNLTRAQKLRVEELDGKWAAAKQEREAAHQRRKEAKAAWEEAERAWVEAEKRVKAVSAEKLRSNLTRAQKLRVEQLDGEWEAAKQERDEANQKRKAVKEALESAQKAFDEAHKAWQDADDAVKLRLKPTRAQWLQEETKMRQTETNRKEYLQELRSQHWVVSDQPAGEDEALGQALWKTELLQDLEELKVIKDQHLERKRELEAKIHGFP
ncbi:hypothetical protein Aspvir_008007 [Aspergillus viridinutans]|uniref:Uncharacterized protein n=1 Tax=Aspergillus viridinutans TaxID=75553 RepID=A0A9P3C1K5_ASPVI|nr:uncharacterized protein Aspvir_008007 [Aspergillus viridinutans]GIK03932.1 hypothetical protein Aspvir_008007 [Aspergillus viridinutans]